MDLGTGLVHLLPVLLQQRELKLETLILGSPLDKEIVAAFDVVANHKIKSLNLVELDTEVGWKALVGACHCRAVEKMVIRRFASGSKDDTIQPSGVTSVLEKLSNCYPSLLIKQPGPDQPPHRIESSNWARDGVVLNALEKMVWVARKPDESGAAAPLEPDLKEEPISTTIRRNSASGATQSEDEDEDDYSFFPAFFNGDE
mmetsp:Transcript_29953/g.44511  ORF Transcript_29953/g.44511 Transcript_29953/m.44511 type:complete len:201 (-) Transcript_29953:52-654(-)